MRLIYTWRLELTPNTQAIDLKFTQFREIDIVTIATVQCGTTRVWPRAPGDDIHKSALARTIRTDDRAELAFFQIEI